MYNSAHSYPNGKYCAIPACPASHTDNIGINPGLGFNTGFILRIAGNFSISAEIIPQLVLRYSIAEKISGSNKVKDNTTGGSVALNNESARISFVYSWNKK